MYNNAAHPVLFIVTLRPAVARQAQAYECNCHSLLFNSQMQDIDADDELQPWSCNQIIVANFIAMTRICSILCSLHSIHIAVFLKRYNSISGSLIKKLVTGTTLAPSCTNIAEGRMVSHTFCQWNSS